MVTPLAPSYKVNGDYVSSLEAEVSARWIGGTFELTDVQSVDWKDKVTLTKVYGRGDEAIGRSGGMVEAEDGSLAVTLAQAVEFEEKAVASIVSGKKRLSRVQFDVTIKYAVNDDSPVIVVRMGGCRIIGRDGKVEAGKADPQIRTWPLSVMRIVSNGVTL